MAFEKLKSVFGGNKDKIEIKQEEKKVQEEPSPDKMDCFEVDRNKIKEMLEDNDTNIEDSSLDEYKNSSIQPIEIFYEDGNKNSSSINDTNIIDVDEDINKSEDLFDASDKTENQGSTKSSIIDFGLNVGGDIVPNKHESDTISITNQNLADTVKKESEDEVKDKSKDLLGKDLLSEDIKLVKDNLEEFSASDNINKDIVKPLQITQTESIKIPKILKNKNNNISSKTDVKDKGDKDMSKQHKFLREDIKNKFKPNDKQPSDEINKDELADLIKGIDFSDKNWKTNFAKNLVNDVSSNNIDAVKTEEILNKLSDNLGINLNKDTNNSSIENGEGDDTMNVFGEKVEDFKHIGANEDSYKSESKKEDSYKSESKKEDSYKSESKFIDNDKPNYEQEVLDKQPELKQETAVTTSDNFGLSVVTVNPTTIGLPSTVQVERLIHTKLNDVAPFKLTSLKDRRGKLSDKVEEMEDFYGASVLPVSVCGFKLPVEYFKRHIMFDIDGRTFTSGTTRIVNKEYFDNLCREITYAIEEGSEYRCSLVTSIKIGNEQVKTLTLNQYEINTLCTIFEDFDADIYKVSTGEYLLIVNS